MNNKDNGIFLSFETKFMRDFAGKAILEELQSRDKNFKDIKIFSADQKVKLPMVSVEYEANGKTIHCSVWIYDLEEALNKLCEWVLQKAASFKKISQESSVLAKELERVGENSSVEVITDIKADSIVLFMSNERLWDKGNDIGFDRQVLKKYAISLINEVGSGEKALDIIKNKSYAESIWELPQ